ncbi:MAG TPA: hypothetical protein DDW76_34545 [Cyanobacteria bacterium UBA11369]|nr:hypothetical protein [Cyanobacteria bacterium UBA11371]HBE33612.1 hypothetical protein [Cyanobacteria bacterium UBA11368]HBE53734.1 hypothetical protein [Cyanobacteria bacterium UBA11369]
MVMLGFEGGAMLAARAFAQIIAGIQAANAYATGKRSHTVGCAYAAEFTLTGYCYNRGSF